MWIRALILEKPAPPFLLHHEYKSMARNNVSLLIIQHSAHSLLPFLNPDKNLEATYPLHAFPKWLLFIALMLHQILSTNQVKFSEVAVVLAVLLSGQTKVSDLLKQCVGGSALTWEKRIAPSIWIWVLGSVKKLGRVRKISPLATTPSHLPSTKGTSSSRAPDARGCQSYSRGLETVFNTVWYLIFWHFQWMNP